VALDHHSQRSHQALEIDSRHASVADLMPVVEHTPAGVAFYCCPCL
jgi:hypothetical protein